MKEQTAATSGVYQFLDRIFLWWYIILGWRRRDAMKTQETKKISIKSLHSNHTVDTDDSGPAPDASKDINSDDTLMDVNTQILDASHGSILLRTHPPPFPYIAGARLMSLSPKSITVQRLLAESSSYSTSISKKFDFVAPTDLPTAPAHRTKDRQERAIRAKKKLYKKIRPVSKSSTKSTSFHSAKEKLDREKSGKSSESTREENAAHYENSSFKDDGEGTEESTIRLTPELASNRSKKKKKKKCCTCSLQ